MNYKINMGVSMNSAVKSGSVHIKKVAINLLKVIIYSYVLTGLLLLIFALIMYKADLKDQQIRLGILIITILCVFVAGFLSSKAIREKRLIYGCITGIAYFLILLIVSLCMHNSTELTKNTVTMFFICLGSGALGGMLG